MAKLELQRKVQDRYSRLQQAGVFGAPANSPLRTKLKRHNEVAINHVIVLRGAVHACFDQLAPKQKAATPMTTKEAFLPSNVIGSVQPIIPDVGPTRTLDPESWCAAQAGDAVFANGGYKDLTAAYAAMAIPLPVSYFHARNDFHSTVRPGGGLFGDWTSRAMCPKDEYGIGYSMRVEGSQGDHDDSALNAVELICANDDRTETSRHKRRQSHKKAQFVIARTHGCPLVPHG